VGLEAGFPFGRIEFRRDNRAGFYRGYPGDTLFLRVKATVALGA